MCLTNQKEQIKILTEARPSNQSEKVTYFCLQSIQTSPYASNAAEQC